MKKKFKIYYNHHYHHQIFHQDGIVHLKNLVLVKEEDHQNQNQNQNQNQKDPFMINLQKK